MYQTCSSAAGLDVLCYTRAWTHNMTNNITIIIIISDGLHGLHPVKVSQVILPFSSSPSSNNISISSFSSNIFLLLPVKKLRVFPLVGGLRIAGRGGAGVDNKTETL